MHTVDKTEIPTGTERILMVDDEDFMVFPRKIMLENLGYRVTGMTNPIDALERFRENPNGYDLVITDFTMMEMTGDELTAEILAIRPDMPVILTSGNAGAYHDARIRKIGVKSFIPKPCRKADLAKTVRRVLDGE